MKLKISGSVGRKGKNSPNDVKLIKALLNIYNRHLGTKTLKIDEKPSEDLTTNIENFQKAIVKMNKPDGQVTSSNSGSFRALIKFMRSIRTTKPINPPKSGTLTWNAEGQEGGRFHSRVLHVPSNTSGLTIGRGYDMKQRSTAEIKSELLNAGIKPHNADILSKAAGFSGEKARQFIIDNDLLDYEVTPATQLKLFENTYVLYLKDVKRISSKTAVIKKYGSVDWEKLNSQIIDVIVDLRFRGDYHGATRKILQKSVADNDFDAFKKHIDNKQNWKLWPTDRYLRRKSFLNPTKNTSRNPSTAIKITGTPE